MIFHDISWYLMIFNDIYTSSTRTRRGGSCLKAIHKTFLIYRTCMRRAPAKPVRACTLRNWCLVSHVTFEAPLHTSHLTVSIYLIALKYCLYINRRSSSLEAKKRFWSTFEKDKRKIISAKIEKICWQITVAALMQPLQYDLRSSAARNNSITHAAAAPSNLDAATTMRSAATELQNTIELRATASETAAPKPDLDAKATKRRFWSTF